MDVKQAPMVRNMFDIYRKWKAHQKILRKLDTFGDVFFVDRENGNNAFSGLTPSQAKLDINAAVALCEDYKSDVVVFKGRLTGGQKFTESQIIDKHGVHLIGAGAFFGMGGFRNSCFVGPNTADFEDDYGNKGALILGADSIEVTGLKFWTPDPTQIQYHIICADIYGSYNCRDFAIHDNCLQGMNQGTGDRQSGVLMLGNETGYFGKNLLYYCENGVKVMPGSRRHANGLQIEDNRIRGSKYSILLGGATIIESWIKENIIMQKSLYGYAMTNGIHVVDGINGNFFIKNYVGHRTLNTAFRKGTGTNEWILNYCSGDGAAGVGGGTLYAET